jgi:D-glycero-D-manno-heptose 1,7-bisphosphate phosphatase
MLVIFDLDGTLTPQRPSSTAAFEFKLLPGVREKCARLRAQGHVLAVATNQGGLRKGLDEREVMQVLEWTRRELGVSAYRYASGRTPGRKKPAPGMLVELMRELGFPPDETTFVGDAESDRLAALAAGVRFAWAKEFFR